MRPFQLTAIAMILAFMSTQQSNAAPAPGLVPQPHVGPSHSAPPYRDATGVTRAPVTDAQIDQHISSALPPEDRAVIHGVMLQLPYNERYNVIYYATNGKIYANEPALLRGAKVYQPTAGNPRIGVAADGTRVTLAPTQSVPSASYNCASPPNSNSTGAYRGVYSICSTPYDLSQAYLPCRSEGEINLVYPNNEVVYEYLGGFSSSGNAIDAGMQHSWTYDNWTLFVRGSRGQLSNPTRYQCNQTVSMEFYPASPTLVAGDVSGYTTSGSYLNVTQTYQVQPSEFWSPSCKYCLVKRITSLAQSGFLNFKDGSYAGIDIYTNPRIAWLNSLVGYWNGQYPARFNVQTWSNTYTGAYYSYPSNDPSRIIVNFVNGGNETDGIYLHP